MWDHVRWCAVVIQRTQPLARLPGPALYVTATATSLAGTAEPAGILTGARHARVTCRARYFQVMERMAGPGVIPGTPHCPLRFLRGECWPLEQWSWRHRFPGFSARFDHRQSKFPDHHPRLLPAHPGSGLAAASRRWETGCCFPPLCDMKHIS